MPDLSQIASDLRTLPDTALQRELAAPSGVVPGYLVLAEAQRRQTLRSAAQARQPGQSGSVYDDVIRNMLARQPPAGLPPVPVGMAPVASAQPAATLGSPPANFRAPVAMAMADGGAVDDDQSDSEGEAARAATQRIHVPDLREAMIDQEGSRRPGTPGFRNNNPGNLRFAGQSEAIGKDPFGFAIFPNWAAGVRAMDSQIRTNLGRGLTLSEMIGGKKGVYPGWAPAADRNKPAQYTSYVAKRTGYDPNLMMEEGAAPAAAPQPVLAAPDWQPSLPALGADATSQSVAPTDTSAVPGQATRQFTPPPAQAPAAPDVPEAPAPGATAAPAAASGPSDDTWRLNLPGRVAPLAAPTVAEPSVAERYFASGDQSDIRQQLQRLREQYGTLAKPNFWQMLADFGWGMAASPSHFLGQQIGAGGQAMSKSLAARQEEARRAQLDLLGVDLKLDDQARLHQEKLEAIHNQAVQQAMKQQDVRFGMLAKQPGAVVGTTGQAPGNEYIYTPSPSDPTVGVWSLPGQLPVTPELIPHLGTNPLTGQPFQGGEMVSTPRVLQARKDAMDVAKAAAKKTEDVAPDATVNYYVGQIQKDGMNWQLVPPKWKEQVGNALAQAGVDVPRLDATTRALQLPQDPQEVEHWATQVQNDAKNWSLIQSNKGLAEAVRQRLAAQGVNVTQLDAQTRSTAQFAHTVRPHIDNTFSLIDKLDQQGKLGPLFGRWNEWRAGKWGAGDPDYIALRNNINLIDSAVARIHGGARGGGSPPMIQYMHEMLSAGPKDAASMRAGLNVFNDWVKGYEGMAPGFANAPAAGEGRGTVSPPTGSPSPPRPAEIPWDAPAQYNPATRQWRYRPRGSTQWQILP